MSEEGRGDFLLMMDEQISIIFIKNYLRWTWGRSSKACLSSLWTDLYFLHEKNLWREVVQVGSGVYSSR